jgi:hypothetical protein
VFVARLLGLLLTLALALVLVLVWARVVSTLTEPTEARPPIGQPKAVVWQDRVFTTELGLRRFLRARGISYSRWISRHPSALAVLRPR